MLLAVAALGVLLAQSNQPPPRYPHAVLSDAAGPPIVVQNDDDAELAGTQLFFAAGLEREPQNQSGIAALAAESIVRTPVHVPGLGLLPVRDAIERAGGSLTYTVEGRDVHYYLEARAQKIAPLLRAFAAAIAKPDFSAPTVGLARTALITRIDQNESNPLTVGIAMFKRSYYLNGAGLPVMGTAASLQRLGSNELAKFYADGYRRGGFSAAAVGKVTPEFTTSLRALAAALPAGDAAPVLRSVKTLSATNGTRIVAQRDVGAPFLVVGFGAPSPADKDFGAMLLIESLMATSFDRSGSTTPTLAQRTVSAFYLYDSTPASFIVFVNGARVEPTLALREVLLVTQSLATKSMQPDSLDRFKTAATGAFVSDALTLADRSYLIGTLQQQGLGADAMNIALDALQHTTAQDVQRVAKRYLQKYIVTMVLPRAG